MTAVRFIAMVCVLLRMTVERYFMIFPLMFRQVDLWLLLALRVVENRR